MTMPADQVRLLTLLRNHAGLRQAITLEALSEAMGYGTGKTGTRHVQRLKRALVEQGYPIGSSTLGIGGGYYWIESQDEIEATLKQYCGRFYSTSVLIKKMRALVGQPASPQQSLMWGD